jgi:hypothetical protein
MVNGSLTTLSWLGGTHAQLNAPDPPGDFTPDRGCFLLPTIHQLIGSEIGSVCGVRTTFFDQESCAPLEIAIGQHTV